VGGEPEAVNPIIVDPEGVLGEVGFPRPQIEVELDDVEPGEQVTFHFSNGMKIEGPFVCSGPGFALLRQGRGMALVQLEHVAVMEL